MSSHIELITLCQVCANANPLVSALEIQINILYSQIHAIHRRIAIETKIGYETAHICNSFKLHTYTSHTKPQLGN